MSNTDDSTLHGLIKEMGRMAGAVEGLGQRLEITHSSITQNVQQLRDDLGEFKKDHAAHIEKLETSINARFQKHDDRISALEKSDRGVTGALVKVGAFSSGAGSILTYVAIEILKRVH